MKNLLNIFRRIEAGRISVVFMALNDFQCRRGNGNLLFTSVDKADFDLGYSVSQVHDGCFQWVMLSFLRLKTALGNFLKISAVKLEFANPILGKPPIPEFLSATNV